MASPPALKCILIRFGPYEATSTPIRKKGMSIKFKIHFSPGTLKENRSQCKSRLRCSREWTVRSLTSGREERCETSSVTRPRCGHQLYLRIRDQRSAAPSRPRASPPPPKLQLNPWFETNMWFSLSCTQQKPLKILERSILNHLLSTAAL